MDEITLYEHILGIKSPWLVDDVQLDKSSNVVSVHVAIDEDVGLSCPECGRTSPRYDKRRRRWRHLDTCQLQTYVEADVPRIQCKKHGCKTVQVPWAEGSARYTMLFESVVLNWLKTASINTVRERFALSWNAVDGVMQRAITRGLKRKTTQGNLAHIYVDETPYAKRRKFVTVVSDALGHVIYVAEGSGKASPKPFYDSLSRTEVRSIRTIAMDMSPSYIHATLDSVPRAKSKIAFDRFHVARSINKAVDQTRHSERMQVRENPELKVLDRSRYLWMKNRKNLTQAEKRKLVALRKVADLTSEAWRLKEISRGLWHFTRKNAARQVWTKWCDDAERSKIRPMMTVASTIRNKLWGIVNASYFGVTNAQAESINSRIKMVKTKARGFRNLERFKRAILFYCGGLDLYPR